MRTGSLEVRATASLLSHARVGVIVPKFKRSGVDRNRLKRRLRELIRIRLLHAVPHADIVVRADPAAYDASFDQLAAQIDRARTHLCRLFPVG